MNFSEYLNEAKSPKRLSKSDISELDRYDRNALIKSSHALAKKLVNAANVKLAEENQLDLYFDESAALDSYVVSIGDLDGSFGEPFVMFFPVFDSYQFAGFVTQTVDNSEPSIDGKIITKATQIKTVINDLKKSKLYTDFIES